MLESNLIGFHPHMPFDKYLAIDALSNSGLKKLAKSPAHYKAPDKPRTPQQQLALDIGSAFHTATLEPELYDELYCITKTARVSAAERASVKEQGKTLLKQADHSNVQAMARAVREHPDAGPLVQGGVTEISFFWQDPDFGFLCKGRADQITDSRIIVDLKSTADADDQNTGYGAFVKNFFSLGYHQQAYWYLNGVSIASGVPHDQFVFIACEKDPPYGINVYWPDKEVLLWAMEKIEPLKLRYAECLESGLWPSYPTGIKIIEMPGWAKKRDY
ncbi:MAG: PD-(D/E)XK nuclease-like domain-containing protein [Deltaproteobacteria bacterium]|nr:PD-(D/E)XK nuclease-like domain-containing protein [Deltaproteobacteria bacterium]